MEGAVSRKGVLRTYGTYVGFNGKCREVSLDVENYFRRYRPDVDIVKGDSIIKLVDYCCDMFFAVGRSRDANIGQGHYIAVFDESGNLLKVESIDFQRAELFMSHSLVTDPVNKTVAVCGEWIGGAQSYGCEIFDLALRPVEPAWQGLRLAPSEDYVVFAATKDYMIMYDKDSISVYTESGKHVAVSHPFYDMSPVHNHVAVHGKYASMVVQTKGRRGLSDVRLMIFEIGRNKVRVVADVPLLPSKYVLNYGLTAIREDLSMVAAVAHVRTADGSASSIYVYVYDIDSDWLSAIDVYYSNTCDGLNWIGNDKVAVITTYDAAIYSLL